MSSVHNLDEKVGKDYFEFILGGYNYKMAYPSSNDMLAMIENDKANEDLQTEALDLTAKLENADPKDAKALNKRLAEISSKIETSQIAYLDWCSKYISSEAENAPVIKDFLLTKNIKYLMAFSDMVKTELND